MKRPQWMKPLLRMAAFLSLFFVIAACLIVWDGLTDEVESADVAVVLGNRIERDGTPSDRLKGRLDKAVGLYKKGLFTHIVVSGGTGKEGYDEASVMRDYLVGQGIPETIIFVDSDGVNTYHTAKKSAQLMAVMNWKSAMVISQYFHISRTRLALQRFGVEQVYAAHADYYEIRDIYSLAREVVAYAYYLLRSYRN